MSGTRAAGRVFSIPPGASFLRTFVAHFLRGDIVPGYPAGDEPFALARATIFVPTQRAASALTREFVRASARGATILPTIVPLGRLDALDPDPAEALDAAPYVATGPIAEISDFERRLILTSLVRAWAEQVKHAIVRVDADGGLRTNDEEALLIGASFGAAWSLAGELGDLIDEFAIEGIPWDALDRLAPEEFDPYWGITLQFLRIVTQSWPRHLAEHGQIDSAARRIALLDERIARLDTVGAEGPLLVVGSTGANAATARLLKAISRLPEGAIVLPGLDMTLDDVAWSMLSASPDAGDEPVTTHPQATLARLLRTLDLRREDVVELGDPPPVSLARNRLLSEALRPAETTDSWRDLRATDALAKLAEGLDGLSVIMTADENEEALAIAIKLRECLEHGQRAALITPDRDIARRVGAQLARWNVEIDDSAGESLGRSRVGAHARLVLNMASDEIESVDVVALLTHPLTALGLERDELDRLARLLDLAVLRGAADPSADVATMIASARQRTTRRDAHPNARTIDMVDWDAMAEMLGRLWSALTPLRDARGPASIAEWAERHQRSIVAIRAATDEDESEDGSAELDATFAELTAHGHRGEQLFALEYINLFDRIVAETPVRRRTGNDVGIQILGLLEARLLDFDVAVIAGLDEGVWPPKARTDAFLNRSMRASLGMSAPERRLGQTAHDQTQLMGAREVVIARAAKRGGAPTVPSRFVQRLAALVGVERWRSCVERGARLTRLARAIDARPRERISPPMPRPPLELRPLSLSVTRIETLRRDPYSIYAERILRLRPLDPLVVSLGARDHGVALHEAVAAFSHRLATPGAGGRTLDDLMALARHHFEDFFDVAGFAEFNWPRLQRVLHAYHAWESARAAELSGMWLEISGKARIPLNDGSIFELTAQADRIEQRKDGDMTVLDFKTGRTPSNREVIAGFAPQLVLEAGMLERGAFGIEKAGAIDAFYIKLGGPNDLEVKAVGGKTASMPDLVADQFEGLAVLLNQLRDPDTAYASRPYPQFLARFGDYDHLARVKEWASFDEDGDAA